MFWAFFALALFWAFALGYDLIDLRTSSWWCVWDAVWLTFSIVWVVRS